MGADPLLARFADALDYPDAGLPGRLDACIAAAGSENGEAAALLARFRTFVLATDPGRLEELYTAAFDMREASAPYLGVHLFHGDPRRGPFMARLAETFRLHGFSAGGELPDHLGVVLRYLALNGGDEDGEELLALAVVPAVAAVAGALVRQAHPWGPLLEALLLCVRARVRDAEGAALAGRAEAGRGTESGGGPR